MVFNTDEQYATYSIKKFVINLREPVVEIDLAIEAVVLLVRSLGKSPTSEHAEIYDNYDLDRDVHETVITLRYIDIPGYTFKLPNPHTSAIRIRIDGSTNV